MVYLFGLLGFEQVFIRFSNVKIKNEIQTQRIQFKIVLVTCITTSILLSLIYFIYFQEKNTVNPILFFLAIFSLTLSPVIFNIFRLNSQYSLAQIVANGWKIILFLIASGIFLLKISNLNLLVILLLISIILIVIITAFVVKSRIRFTYNQEINSKQAYTAFSMFFISIASFSLVMFADRFIIESKLGTVIFGDYFYLSNFVLAPFSLLQNYVGFRQVVYFKEKFSIEGFKKFIKQISLLAIFLSVFIVFILAAVIYFDFLNFDFMKYQSVIFLLLLLGIVRLHSSSILPAFEVKTSLESLKKANLLVISISLIISLIIIYFVNSLQGIILGFICIWMVRSLVYRYLLIQQVKKENLQ